MGWFDQTNTQDGSCYLSSTDYLVDGSKVNSEMYLILASSTELIMCERT
jgi:hypothetical protein